MNTLSEKIIRFQLLILLLLFCLFFCSTVAQAQNENSYDYTLIHRVIVENDSASYASQARIIVPLIDEADLDYCKLIGVEYDPAPSEIITESDGHRYAVYRSTYLRAAGTLILQQKYALTTINKNYNIDNTETVTISNEELTLYADELLSTADAPCNNAQIINYTVQTVGSETDVYRRARMLFGAINLLLTYSNAEQPQDALSVLQRKTADCAGYTNLYLACLRAAGIPARQQSGYLYHAKIDDMSDLSTNSHTWVEFYLPGHGWIIADPTFTYTYDINNVTHKFVNWDYFATITGDRRYLHFRSGNIVPNNCKVTATGGHLYGVFSAILEKGHNYVPFADIRNHWAQDEITYCVEQGLFNGISSTKFAPNTNMTRAMFVTVLGRLYETHGGKTISSIKDSSFIDVNNTSYYYPYLLWAIENNLINGYDSEHFAPNDSITREQLATITANFMTRLYDKKNYDDLSFIDTDQISDWARSGVGYCVNTGIVTGFEDNSFRPAGNATRSQVAAILYRMASLVL